MVVVSRNEVLSDWFKSIIEGKEVIQNITISIDGDVYQQSFIFDLNSGVVNEE